MAHLEWENDAGHVIAVKFDAVRTVEHRQNATATKHPVQGGSDIADHVRVELPSVSVTGYVSKAPLTTSAKIGARKDAGETSGEYRTVELPPSPGKSTASLLQGGLLQAGLDALKGIASPSKVETIVTNEADQRVGAMTALLTEAQQAKRLVRFVDEAATYEDMVITGVVVNREQRMFGAAFQVELEQILQVASKTVDAPVPREPRGALQKAAGAVAAKAGANESVDEKKKSAAIKLGQGLFGGVEALKNFVSGGF